MSGFLIFLGICLFVAGAIVAGLNRQTSDKANLAPGSWLLRVSGVAAVVLGMLYGMVIIVPAGHSAVLMRFGAVQGELGEGIHMILPVMNTTELMEVRTQKEESTGSAASRDLQVVSTTVALNFRVDPTKVGELYRNVGREYKSRIIDPAVQESVKTVTARYTAEDLIRSRSQVKQQVEEEITRRLSNYGLMVEQDGVSITNFDFSPEFNKAIEAKQVSQQEAEKQKYILQRAELERQTAVAKAKGEAESAKLNAEALKVQGGELVVAREWITKWDGKLPQVAGGGQYILDVKALMDKAGN
jgi:regulator of protease activity HflC (stomatin/prohibitin superfamily)